MKEISEDNYMQDQIKMKLGFIPIRSVFTGRESPLQGEDITGKLEYDSGRFYIATSEGEKIPIIGNDCLLTDPAWREEEGFGNITGAKIRDRYGNGKEVVWHGQRQESGFLPYMTKVCIDGDTGNDKFYSGDNSLIFGVLKQVLER